MWLVFAADQPFEVSEEAQHALRDRLLKWANGTWLVERLDVAGLEGYEPSPDERTALINAANDVARSSAPDAVKDEVRKLREFLIQHQPWDEPQTPAEPS
jgi:hypothetical protein